MSNSIRRRLALADILPKQEPSSRSSVTLPDRQWTRLKEISEITVERAEAAGVKSGGFTRDEIMKHFLDWAIQEWEAEEAEAAPAKRLRK
jgi:hypothetical protein